MDSITVTATGPNDITVTVTFHGYDLSVILSTASDSVAMERLGVNPDPLPLDGDTVNGLIATAKVNVELLAQSLSNLTR